MIIKNMVDAKNAWNWIQGEMDMGQYRIPLTKSTRLVFMDSGKVFMGNDMYVYMDEMDQTPEKVLWKYRKAWNDLYRNWISYGR